MPNPIVPTPHKYYGNIRQLKYRIKLTRVKGKWIQNGHTHTFSPRKGGEMSWSPLDNTAWLTGVWNQTDFNLIYSILGTSFDY